MKIKSDYSIVKVEEDRIFIVDLDLGRRSVTNDAENVVFEISKHFPGKRIIYRDSMKEWDEIVYEIDYNFVKCKFAHYSEHLPDEKDMEAASFPFSEFIRR